MRGVGIIVRALPGARIIGDNAGVAIVMEAGERKGSVNKIRGKALPGDAVFGRYAIAFINGLYELLNINHNVKYVISILP